MENQIKRAAAWTRGLYGVFWLLPLLGVMAGEMGSEWAGAWASQVRTVYLAESLCILLAAVCVPVSLKLFVWVLEKRIDVMSLPVALKCYVGWCGIRLAILELPVMAGLATYYMMWSNKGVLCALIGLTASLFCLPGEKRLRRELRIEKEGEENHGVFKG